MKDGDKLLIWETNKQQHTGDTQSHRCQQRTGDTHSHRCQQYTGDTQQHTGDTHSHRCYAKRPIVGFTRGSAFPLMVAVEWLDYSARFLVIAFPEKKKHEMAAVTCPFESTLLALLTRQTSYLCVWPPQHCGHTRIYSRASSGSSSYCRIPHCGVSNTDINKIMAD